MNNDGQDFETEESFKVSEEMAERRLKKEKSRISFIDACSNQQKGIDEQNELDDEKLVLGNKVAWLSRRNAYAIEKVRQLIDVDEDTIQAKARNKHLQDIILTLEGK